MVGILLCATASFLLIHEWLYGAQPTPKTLFQEWHSGYFSPPLFCDYVQINIHNIYTQKDKVYILWISDLHQSVHQQNTVFNKFIAWILWLHLTWKELSLSLLVVLGVPAICCLPQSSNCDRGFELWAKTHCLCYCQDGQLALYKGRMQQRFKALRGQFVWMSTGSVENKVPTQGWSWLMYQADFGMRFLF